MPQDSTRGIDTLPPYKSLLNCLVLLVVVFWAFPAHAQEALWEQHSQAGEEAFSNGEIASARQHILAAIEAAKVLGPENPRLGVSLSDLGLVSRALADYEGAEMLFEESLSILAKRLGLHHPWTIRTLNNLAGLYVEIGRYSDAAPLYRQVIRVTVTCPWRIGIHAATGSSTRPPQCFSQVKLRSAAGCVTTLPPTSAGVFPSSDAWVRD